MMNDDAPTETSSFVLDALSWAENSDEKRRAFIIDHFPWDSNYKGKSQVRAMERIFQWLKYGTLLRFAQKRG